MNVASLLPRGNEIGPITARPLLVHTGDAATCIVVRRGLVGEGVLTSLDEETLQRDVYGSDYRTTWITRDNPFLAEDQRARLDAHGVIRTGTKLEPGDILVSVLESDLPRPGRVTRPGLAWVQDQSWPVPAHWLGASVLETRVLGRAELGGKVGRGVRQRVCIRLRAQHPLAIGDLLMCEVDTDPQWATTLGGEDGMRDDILGVVGAILDDEQMPRASDGRCADVIVPTAVARRRAWPATQTALIGKAAQTGVQFAQTRAMGGGYSLITQQPLRGERGGCQDISLAHVHWLLTRGLTAHVGELASLKSDDLRQREILDTLRRAGNLTPEAVRAPGMPESLAMMRTELMALGLAVTLQDAGHAVAITLRAAANQDVIAWSNGAIRKPETLNYKTLLDVEGGLFCPKVFGSDDHARRQRWGHVELPAPVISPLWRFGSPSLLERLLGLTSNEIEALLDNELWLRQADGVWQTVAAPVKNKKGQPPQPEAGQLTGAVAIEAMLKSVAPQRLPAVLCGRAETLALRVMPIMPPDARPLVLLDDGNFATADVNDLYRRLINRANRLAKLEELKAPVQIIWHERRELQHAADALWANCMATKRSAILGSSNRPLVDCLELLVRRLMEEKSKRVEWCARARVVALAALAEGRLLVPRGVFSELQLDAEQPVLVTAEGGDGAFVALLPEPHDHAVFAMAPPAYRQLGLDEGTRNSCVLHRPLGDKACAEARRLLHGDPGAFVQVGPGTSWFDATQRDALVSGLVEAAMNERRVLLDSPRGMLLAGTGCVDLVADAELPAAPRQVLEVPKPVEPAPLSGELLRVRIRAVLKACKRKACIFRLTRIAEEPALGAGRVGGLPDLPPGVEWPRVDNGYLPFLAQLPLDAAHAAGVLPMDVAPGSLLTIFESSGEDTVAAPGAVFVVSASARLERRSAPAKVHTYPWCKLEAEIVEELPSWEETVDLLKAELSPIDPDELRAFHDSEWASQPCAAEAIKLGGWPAWIQAPESEAPLVAQVASNDLADMCFVDGWTLYVFANEGAGYEVVLQYY